MVKPQFYVLASVPLAGSRRVPGPPGGVLALADSDERASAFFAERLCSQLISNLPHHFLSQKKGMLTFDFYVEVFLFWIFR
jgi:hypothetical protein